MYSKIYLIEFAKVVLCIVNCARVLPERMTDICVLPTQFEVVPSISMHRIFPFPLSLSLSLCSNTWTKAQTKLSWKYFMAFHLEIVQEKHFRKIVETLMRLERIQMTTWWVRMSECISGNIRSQHKVTMVWFGAHFNKHYSLKLSK